MSSSRRATNNSSVASLEDQSRVISQVLGQAGVPSTSSSESGGKKSKSGKKKTPVPEKDVEAAGRRQPADPGSGLAPGRDVTCQPGAGDAAAPDSGARSSRAQPTHGAEAALPSNGHGNVLGNDQGQGDPPVLSNSNNNMAFLGMPAVAEASREALALQQQWLWQQMFQGFGNYVPNAAFGQAPEVFWGREDAPQETESPLAELVRTARETRERQPDHVLSDDEDDEACVPEVRLPVQIPNAVAMGAVVPEGPSTAQGTVELVKGHLSQVKECDKVSGKVTQDVADLLDGFLAEAVLISDMEKLAKKYPRVENVARMKLQRLDPELFGVMDQTPRTTDQTFQSIQRGVLACMSALTPVLELAFTRDRADAELCGLGANVVDGLQLLSYVNNALLTRRRELLKPHLDQTYAKSMTKAHNPDSDWLYGGDLVETTKQCEAAKKIAEKVLKRKQQQQQQRGRGGQNKRFRAPFGGLPFPAAVHMPRAFNGFQVPQFRAPFQPQMMQGFQQYPTYIPQQQFSAGLHRRGRGGRFRQPGFQKRGAPGK